jgi:thiosulfate/3-mercaptopyruvate sulfurtransferase
LQIVNYFALKLVKLKLSAIFKVLTQKLDKVMLNIKKDFFARLLLILITLLFAGSSLADKHHKFLLTVDEVRSSIGRENTVLVDVRPLFKFKKLHIKGAVSVPTDETFTKSGRSDLVATVVEMRELMSKAGITEKSQVIIYGDKNPMDVSRLFWVFETFGLTDVSIMNNSLTNWKKLGYPTESGLPNIKPSTIYPALREEKLATMLMVFSSIKKENESLIDARPEQEYKGEQSYTGVYGRIPTAINIPWYTNLTPDFLKFKTIPELKELYKAVDMMEMNTVYCNQGKESAVNYVALRMLGANVRAYDGSWFEWGQQKGLPISNPAKH